MRILGAIGSFRDCENFFVFYLAIGCSDKIDQGLILTVVLLNEKYRSGFLFLTQEQLQFYLLSGISDDFRAVK
jgi:hypothetical protein